MCVKPARWAVLAVMVATGAQAQEKDVIPGDFSGKVTLASDYLFRGISQTDENPAIQGGLDWKHPSGVFVGAWGSNVDFDDGDQATLELDWYAGYAGEFRGIGFDIRGIYYSYPGADTPRDYDYWEIGTTLSYTAIPNLNLALGYNFSPDYFNESGTGHYVHLDGAYSLTVLPLPVTLKGSLGHQWIRDNDIFGTPDYWHWSVGIAVTVEKLEIGVSYADTDIKKRECGASLDICGGRFLVGASYAM